MRLEIKIYVAWSGSLGMLYFETEKLAWYLLGAVICCQKCKSKTLPSRLIENMKTQTKARRSRIGFDLFNHQTDSENEENKKTERKND